MTMKQKGFTLIELLIVVAIIGILATIAIPNLLTALQKARQKRTMSDMRSISTAWEARATDVNAYNAAGLSWPPATAPASSIASMLTPTYVKTIPLYDGWAMEFQVSNNSRDSYSVKSYGADRTENSTVTSAPSGIATNHFDCDIILSAGYFVQYPEGIQSQ